MGAWGNGILDNDEAADWVHRLHGVASAQVVETALDRVLAIDRAYLDADAGSIGLAAAEAVARLMGRYSSRNAYTRPMDEWVAGVQIKPSNQLIDKARRVVMRVLTPPSELMELWSEGTEGGAWRANVDELHRRLAQ